MDKSKFKDKKEWKKFGTGLCIILLIIASILLIKGKGSYLYFSGTGILILILAFFIPVLLKPLYIFFSIIGFGLGWFMTRLILNILFYLILTPIGLISKLFGKHFLDLKFKEKKNSFWIPKEQKAEGTGEYEKQF